MTIHPPLEGGVLPSMGHHDHRPPRSFPDQGLSLQPHTLAWVYGRGWGVVLCALHLPEPGWSAPVLHL